MDCECGVNPLLTLGSGNRSLILIPNCSGQQVVRHGRRVFWVGMLPVTGPPLREPCIVGTLIPWDRKKVARTDDKCDGIVMSYKIGIRGKDVY